MSTQLPSIAEWFAGKDILITGGTGFMGKALMEKLLRTCPDLNRIYLIVRPKKGRSIEERKKILFGDVLFCPLLKLYPNALEKVVCLPGDVSELECGLSKEHQEEIIQNVSVVFHGAASVRFDDPLTAALCLNSRGTLELIKLSKQMKKLEVFEYISTTYCNSDVEGTIEEKVYPSHLPWQDLLGALDNNENTLNLMAKRIIGTQPNTYTFTKSLAENIVNDSSDDIPTVIVRPSIVMPTSEEPMPGWIDNLNGLISVTAGMCKGVLRVMKSDPKIILDLVPLDISINGLIIGAWARRFALNNQGTVVLNQVYGNYFGCTNQQSIDFTRVSNDKKPMENFLWYPFLILTTNSLFFNVLFFFLQILPAVLLDSLLFVLGKKRMLVNMNIKIYNAIRAVSSFTTKPFNFANNNYSLLAESVKPEDRKAYKFLDRELGINTFEYTKTSVEGIRTFLFKENEEGLHQKRKVLKRLKIIHYGTIITVSTFVFWKIASALGNMLVEFIASFGETDL